MEKEIKKYAAEIAAACTENVEHVKLNLAALIKEGKRSKPAPGEIPMEIKIRIHIEAIQNFLQVKEVKPKKPKK